MDPNEFRRRQLRDRHLQRLMFLVILAGAAVMLREYERQLRRRRIAPPPAITQGETLMYELLEDGIRCRQTLRLNPASFHEIEHVLTTKGGLQPTRNMSGREQLGIFLLAAADNHRFREISERFGRSVETIHRVYHKVMKCFLHPGVYNQYLKPATAATPPKIRDDASFFPYFEDCVGAIDIFHLPIHVSAGDQWEWRDRNGHITQNVIASCDFGMRFTDLALGWEAGHSDSEIWHEALQEQYLHIPAGKYVLGDTGFPNCDSCLTPYPYIVQEEANPETKEELFNKRHAELSTVITRLFAVMRSRFKVLLVGRKTKIKSQIDFVQALCVLHNMLSCLGDEWEIPAEEGESDLVQDRGANASYDDEFEISEEQRARADERRDRIAEAIRDEIVVLG